MMVERVVNVTYDPLEDNPGYRLIYELAERFNPHLLEAEHCTHVVLWWDTTAREYDTSVKVYAVKQMDHAENLTTQVNSWKSADILSAMQYINERLA
jgi:hypothetical protein